MQYYADDFSAMAAGNLSLTAALITAGYSELQNSGTPSNVAVVAQPSLPSGLQNDLRFPSSTSKQVLKFTLPATDVESRLLWSGFPAGVQTVSVSWWEYRDAGNLGGEKFCRVGNFVSGPGSNRGVDSIITLGQVSGTTLIANSANMHDYGDHSMSPGITGWPGLNHFEALYTLSTGTNANGSVSLFCNGSLIGQASGLQFFSTLSQAATGIQLWDIGGWSSTGGGTEGTVTYPIVRYICAIRIADSYQGVWLMPGARTMLMTGVRTLTGPLPSPAVSSSVSGSTANLSWTAPAPRGQSVIAGYRVYKSSTLGGTYTQVGGTLAPNQLSLADTLSGTAFYKVEAFDQFVTGGRSAGLQCVPVSGQRLKFNPSAAYWQLDYNTSYSTQASRMSALKSKCPQTAGFEVFIPWAHLENPAVVGGAAQYDGSWAAGDQTVISNQRGFKLIDSLLAAASALGCQLMFHIRGLGGSATPGTISSTNYPSNFVPAYLNSTAFGPVSPSTTGEWGGVWVNAPTTSANQVRFAYYIRWWDTRVTARLKLLGAAYGARYDSNPNLEMVGFSADENVVDPFTGCTDAGQIGSLLGSNGLLASWGASFPRTQRRLWANYYQTVSTMDTFLAEAVSRGWSIGGPDTCNDAPVVSSDPTLNSDGRYRSIAAAYRWVGWTAAGGDGGVRDNTLPAYNGVGHCICEVEAEDTAYDTVTNQIIANGRALGDGILPHIVAQANRLGATHMVWFDNTFSGRSQVQTNTAHPNLCDFVSSVAQGGSVAVNGVTAGIALTNTTYPPSFPQ